MAGVYGDVVTGANAGNYNPGQQGVFAEFPLMTPKYARNTGLRDAEFKDTLARMYVALPDASPAFISAYLASLPADDRVQALAQVLIGPNRSSSAPTGFIDFFLSQAQERFSEKVQVDQVLGDNYVAWYFGQDPPVFQYSGNLLNSLQDDQTTGFALAYQNIFRGTALAQRGSLLRLRYDNVIVSGSINDMTRVLNAENELICPFSFSILVKEYVVLVLPQFTKMTVQDFVQLQTQFAPETALSRIASSAATRVLTSTVSPPVLSQTSSVGQEPPASPVQPNTTPPQQLQDAVASSIQSPVTTGTSVDPSQIAPAPPPLATISF